MKQNKKTLIGISVFLLYLMITELQGLPFWLLKIDTDTIPTIIKIIYSCIVEITLICTIILIYNKDIKKDFEDLKKQHQSYFKKYLKYWFLSLGLMIATNTIILIIKPNSVAGNEQTVRDMFKIMPVYIFISAVIFAPLLEELIFRKSFRYMFKNNILFIILSGLTFGLFHVAGNVSELSDLLYLVPYSIPGFVFAYTLSKSDNIFVPIGLHFLHNGILMSLQIFVMLFG